MYSASEKFHEAVFRNSPKERVLFEFQDGTAFTNEDVHAGNGLKIMEAVNLDEELTIGSCHASSLSVTIMNYSRLLSKYAFGECRVSLGVRIQADKLTPVSDGLRVIMNYGADGEATFVGGKIKPYLTVNGDAPSVQPPFPVYAIFTANNKVYCVSESGEVWAADWSGGPRWDDFADETWNDIGSRTWSEFRGELSGGKAVSLNAFMQSKVLKWVKNGRAFARGDDSLVEFLPDGTAEVYEYVPLGVFEINKPERRKIDLISIDAYDRMTLFDRDASGFLDALVYPVTLGEIYNGLCEFVGVPSATKTFINGTRVFNEAPIEADGITCKDVLSWIATAAGSFARMNRDGECELAWFSTDPVSIPMNQYFSVEVAEYEVAQIDKLQIIGSENDVGVIIGTGLNGYQIVDVPYLYGADDTEIRTYGTPIYNRLCAFDSFSPVTATAVCDWSIEAGDIIAIEVNSDSYHFPIYCQTISWNGAARVSYESTGSERRPVMSAENRQILRQNRAMHEIEVTVDGFKSTITGIEDNVTKIQATADGLSTEVSKKVGEDKIISAINQSAETVAISADKISLQGYVTINGTFQIDENGYLRCIGGTIANFTISEDGLSSDALTIDNETGIIELGEVGSIYSLGGPTTNSGYAMAINGSSGLALYAPSITIGNTNGEIRLNCSIYDKNGNEITGAFG